MDGNGDTELLTSPEVGKKESAGIINRTKRSISTVLRENPHKRSSKSRANNEELGWRNPSYEMTEITIENEPSTIVKTMDESLANSKEGETTKMSQRGSEEGRPKQRDRRKRTTQNQPDIPNISENATAETSFAIVNETASGQGDGPPNLPNRRSREKRRERKHAVAAASQERIELATLGNSGEPAGAAATAHVDAAAVDDGRALGVVVHQCDRLDDNRWQLRRPMVRVHLIDINSGEPVRKQDPHRHVSYFYESDDVANILPLMTHPSVSSAAAAGRLLVWDELLLFNESFNYLTGQEPRVCIMLELLTSGQQQHRQQQLAASAWAFLRLTGAGGRSNVGCRLRLQLYQPPTDGALRAKPIYSWWRSAGRHKVAGTLYVTTRAVTPPQPEPSQRSLLATQPERAATATGPKLAAAGAGSAESSAAAEAAARPCWSRLQGQQCRLPTAICLTLADDAEACQALCFDGTGYRLACCVQRDAQYPVLVYHIPSGARTHALPGHAAVVYDVAWADDRLVTASADWTARLWHLDDGGDYQVLVLPHPGYVYTALFHVAAPRFLFTGCYDGVVRVWKTSSRDPDTAEPRLVEELTAGGMPINSLCYAPEISDGGGGGKLFAGDARGQLTVWTWRSRKSRSPEITLDQRVNPEAVGSAAINHLVLHPAGHRLFVQARDGVVVALDTHHLLPLQTLTGHLNGKALMRGCISPCGSYFLSGSEDGCVHVWNADTGERCAAYTGLGSTRPVVGVHFHPWEHMLSVAMHRDPRVAVQVLKYERGMSGADIGLALLPRAIQPATAPATDVGPGAGRDADATALLSPAMAGSAGSLLPPLTMTTKIGTEREQDVEDDRKFQAILDRLDSVMEVARGGGNVSRLSAASAPDGCRAELRDEAKEQAPASTHSRSRQRRRERKMKEALSRTDPGV